MTRLVALCGALTALWPFFCVCWAADESTAPRDPFGEFLTVPTRPADRFDPPRAGETLRAIAHGRVAEITRGRVVIDHVYFENAEQRHARSVYRKLQRILVQAGQEVRRGDPIGTGPRAELTEPSPAFIREHAALPVPGEEPLLILVSHGAHRMRLYERGQLRAEWEVAFGQAEGPKERRGDLKTPVGMYFVVDKSDGPFTGAYSEFFGGRWIKVNYPNAYDAARGLRSGLITQKQHDAISAAWRTRSLTLQNTQLGGGIGFHGWASEWSADEDGACLSWGCVVMHPKEILVAYEAIPVGAMVILLP